MNVSAVMTADQAWDHLRSFFKVGAMCTAFLVAVGPALLWAADGYIVTHAELKLAQASIRLERKEEALEVLNRELDDIGVELKFAEPNSKEAKILEAKEARRERTAESLEKEISDLRKSVSDSD